MSQTPLNETGGSARTLATRLEERQIDQLAEVARRLGITRSMIIRQAIDRELAELKAS